MFLSRLAEKHRLVPEVLPWKGAWSAMLRMRSGGAEQFQHGGDGDQGFHGVEADSRAIRDCSGHGACLLRGVVLSHVFASFAGLGELAVPVQVPGPLGRVGIANASAKRVSSDTVVSQRDKQAGCG